MTPTLPETVDALVVGGGPAGLAAATWLGRYRRSTLVVDAGAHRNRAADRAHGVLTRDPVPPAELIAEARAGLAQYPQVRLHHGTVNTIRRGDDGTFRALIDDRTEVAASRIVLATGVKDRLPRVIGVDEHYGTDVHHCPACDGLTVAGKDAVILGDGAHVPAYAAELLDWARTVRIVTDSSDPGFSHAQREVLSEHRIEVIDGAAEKFVGEPGDLRGVVLTDGTFVPGSAVFFSYGHEPAALLAKGLGCELADDGSVVVNGFQLSSVDGVYAAGDITTDLQLIPIAVGLGTAAGVACATSLRGHGTDGPSPAPPTRRFT